MLGPDIGSPHGPLRVLGRPPFQPPPIPRLATLTARKTQTPASCLVTRFAVAVRDENTVVSRGQPRTLDPKTAWLGAGVSDRLGKFSGGLNSHINREPPENLGCRSSSLSPHFKGGRSVDPYSIAIIEFFH